MNFNLHRLRGRYLPATIHRTGQRRYLRGSLLAVGVFSLLLMAWPAIAAVQLEYFIGLSEPESLVLEWASLREVNQARWDVYCKDELQPPAAFHLIGAVEALGGPNQGHTYTFPVPELTPGLSYCFRLDEITVDGSPGESFDICGLGYGVTPTPIPPELEGAGVVADRSYGPGTPIPGGDAAALQGAIGPSTSTPTATSSVNDSPLATPTSYTQNPLTTPEPLADDSANVAAVAQSSGSAAIVNVEATADQGATAAPTPSPDPGYIVVTATPTSEAVAQLAPTFTPLPTTTPQPDALLAQLTDLNAEDLVLAALCFVFFGATGIGVLGITSLGLYFRSRSGDRRR